MYKSMTNGIQRTSLFATFLLAGALVGGAGGYALAMANATSIVARTELAPVTDVASRDLIARFLASEHQGSAENPNAAALPPASTTIRSNENSGIGAVQAHDFGISDNATGDSGNSNAAAVTGPQNIAFLMAEHQGSSENPNAQGR